MLVQAGGEDLLMIVNNNGISCLYKAAQNGHMCAAEVRKVHEGVCRKIKNRKIKIDNKKGGV